MFYLSENVNEWRNKIYNLDRLNSENKIPFKVNDNINYFKSLNDVKINKLVLALTTDDKDSFHCLGDRIKNNHWSLGYCKDLGFFLIIIFYADILFYADEHGRPLSMFTTPEVKFTAFFHVVWNEAGIDNVEATKKLHTYPVSEPKEFKNKTTQSTVSSTKVGEREYSRFSISEEILKAAGFEKDDKITIESDPINGTITLKLKSGW